MKKRIVAVTLAILVLLTSARCDRVETEEPTVEVSASPSPTTLPSFPTPPTPTPPLETVPPTAPPAPSPSPTPIIHVVQEGETLGGIAAAYGVSPQDLQAANGIENPLLLQIGQELIIPVGGGEESTAPQPGQILPTPTPLSFGVRGVSFYETPVGSLWCLGEVVNTTPYTLTNVILRVTLFDPTGAPLIQGDATAAADVLLPTGRAPFGILFISPPPNFASHQVAVLRGEFVEELTRGYVPIVVEGESGVPLGPQFEISGTARNADPARTATQVMVIVTTYDGEGRVTGFRQQTVEVGEGLPPGGEAPFRLLLTAHGGLPADFSIIAFGRTASGE